MVALTSRFTAPPQRRSAAAPSRFAGRLADQPGEWGVASSNLAAPPSVPHVFPLIAFRKKRQRRPRIRISNCGLPSTRPRKTGAVTDLIVSGDQKENEGCTSFRNRPRGLLIMGFEGEVYRFLVRRWSRRSQQLCSRTGDCTRRRGKRPAGEDD